jgi:peptidoglycan/xylan/chitin deacetylase (PgdA/CDA1 family)
MIARLHDRTITRGYNLTWINENHKKLTIIFLSAILSLITCSAFSQDYDNSNSTGPVQGFTWPEGKKMALSLTFDDARLSQPDKGIPLLDKYSVKATFYVSPGNMISRLEAWKEAVKNGHEIGNHLVLHPCSGNFTWSRSRALEDYTLEKMKTELDSASGFVYENLGVQPVSFAYP